MLIKDWLAELELEGKTIEEGTVEHSWDDEPAADPPVAARPNQSSPRHPEQRRPHGRSRRGRPGRIVTRQNILVVTDDALGKRMAGPAIRAWNIAQVLSADHDVRLASTRNATASSPHFAVCDGSGALLPGLAEGMDIIVLQGFTLYAHPWLADLGAHLVMDMYDPIHLEMLEGSQDRPRGVQTHELTGGLDALRIQFDRGDFFLCASERQRDLWLGHLSALGRVNFATYAQDNTLRKLIEVAPFGIDATAAGTGSARHQGRHRRHRAGRHRAAVGRRRLQLVRPGHPDRRGRRPRGRTAAAAVGVHGHQAPVARGPVDDYSADRRWSSPVAAGCWTSTCSSSRAGCPTPSAAATWPTPTSGCPRHLLHVETAFSFRTRMLDYLWAGLPIVCTEGDEFARIVAARGFGPGGRRPGPGGLGAGPARTAGRSGRRLRACRRAVERTARQFDWERSLAALLEYCADPWRAADTRSSLRPIGRVARWGSRIDDRASHLRAILSGEGIAGLVKRAIRAPIKMVVRPVLRHLPESIKARVRALPDHQRDRFRRLVG